MIKVTHPETGEEFFYTQEEYDEQVRKARAWQRALENAVEVPQWANEKHK